MNADRLENGAIVKVVAYGQGSAEDGAAIGYLRNVGQARSLSVLSSWMWPLASQKPQPQLRTPTGQCTAQSATAVTYK